MSLNTDKYPWRLLLTLLAVTLFFGAVEGFYGRFEYAGDAISYLNVVRAIHSGDWQAAFSTYWGLGYPLLLSAWLPLFPSNPGAEWTGIHCLNLLILTLTFFSFYRLVRQAFRLIQERQNGAQSGAERFLMLAAFPIFLTTEVWLDNASRVSPDMMVSCLVFASVATLLEIKRQPGFRLAIALGVLLGLGYIVKGIFLPLSLAFVGIECAILWRKEKAAKLVAITMASMAVFAIPYAAGLTWAYGRPTLGEVGSINYAWYVNGLQMDVFWEGGPAEFGKPLQPPQQVSSLPSIYLFDSPHAVTYAPWFNPPYYFEGYRRFFNLKRQIHEILRDLHALGGVFMRRLVLYVLIAALILRWRKAADRASFLMRYRRLWPLPAAAFLGLAIYVLVYLQPRHVASFVALLLLTLCLGLVEADDVALDRTLAARSRTVVLTLLAAAWIATVAIFPGEESLSRIADLGAQVSFQNSDQWKAGQYLMATGLHPGDKVAWVADYWELTHYTWAYIANLKLIGQVGGELLEPQHDNLGAFWHSAPQERKRMLEVFHQAGARLVLTLRMPSDADTSEWEQIPGTPMWVYRF